MRVEVHGCAVFVATFRAATVLGVHFSWLLCCVLASHHVGVGCRDCFAFLSRRHPISREMWKSTLPLVNSCPTPLWCCARRFLSPSLFAPPWLFTGTVSMSARLVVWHGYVVELAAHENTNRGG